MLHWVTGALALQVDVDETGPIYLWAKRQGGTAITIDEPCAELNITAAMVLAQMAEVANHANPHWRVAYLHA